MKTRAKINLLKILALLFLSFLTVLSCKKKEEPNMVPDPILNSNFKGRLTVVSTNTLPPWNVTTFMNVQIEKQFGTVSIDNGTLSYSGDTIIQNNSRLQREGEWSMYPIGELKNDGGIMKVEINAQVNVQNDVQRIYAKDDSGNWVLVNTLNFEETPYSTFTFDFEDAMLQGSVVGVSVPTGSIFWTLTISPSLVP